MTDQPRLLKSQDEIERRKEMLSEPHMMPLADYISKLRKSDFGDIPDFDPCDGGVNAQALFLFEKPGPKAFESGFISRNNNDQTAENTFKFMLEARLPREKVCIWNVILGWNGTIKVTTDELKQGIEALGDLFRLLPHLKVVVFVGKKAAKAKPLLEGTNLTLMESVHPSPKNYALARERWEGIPKVWAGVGELLN